LPLPGFVVELLTEHQHRHPPCAGGLVFTSRSGAAVRRTTFRAKVWRPSLVRAGLLGKIVEVGEHKIMVHWHDGEGREWSKEFTTGREAIEQIVRHAHGGLSFHGLRHSYATWLEMSRIASDASFGKICKRPLPATSPFKMDQCRLVVARHTHPDRQ
jgi:integrase